MKSVPISVRITQAESETLARLHLAGATTPSEKLRALIVEAGKHDKGPRDYPEALAHAQQMLAPVFEIIHRSEGNTEQYSEVLAMLREWLPDLLAFTRLTTQHTDNASNSLDREQMLALERGVAERMFRLMERIFQLGIISRCRCYDPELINKHMDLTRQWAEVITQQQNKELS